MGTKTIYVMTAIVIVAAASGIFLYKTVQSTYAHNTFIDEPWHEAIISDPAPESCTIFTASHSDTVLFGNNEDWINPNTYYWVAPPKGGDYGIVFLGFDNFWPQGGINEKGLAFDVNALPKAALNPHPERPRIKNPFYEFLKKCSTVKEVIDRVNSYSWESSWRAQVHVADRIGDAVVISAGPDGEIAFTRKQKGNGYLISTNFNRANPKNGRYPCWRYDTAVAMLEKIRNEDDLTVDYFRSLLDAVHQEGPSVNTVYSNIFDLKNGIIYLYHWHQFYEVAKLDVENELLKAPSPTRIRALFSQETVHKEEGNCLEKRGMGLVLPGGGIISCFDLGPRTRHAGTLGGADYLDAGCGTLRPVRVNGLPVFISTVAALARAEIRGGELAKRFREDCFRCCRICYWDNPRVFLFLFNSTI